MDRIPSDQSNYRLCGVGVSRPTAVCRIHGFEKELSESQIRLTDSPDKPIKKDENVGLAKLGLHSIFSQVDCSLQQMSLGQTGTNYPYKAYIDTLLSSSEDEKVSLESQLFIKDTPGHDSADVKTGSNIGLYRRSLYTDEGRIIEMEGGMCVDAFQTNRLTINGISLSLKLWPSKNPFRLMSCEDNAGYKVQIIDASFKLCVLKPNRVC